MNVKTLVIGLAAFFGGSAFLSLDQTPVFPPELPPLGEEVVFGSDRSDRMTVPVTINGGGPHEFVIDTGAERTMISHELAERLELSRAGSGEVHTLTGKYSVPLYKVPRISVSGDGQAPLLAPAVSRARLGASGLLGVDSLQNSRVHFDMKRKVMTVMPQKKFAEKPREKKGVIVITAERVHGRLLFSTAKLDGVPVRVVIDTGAQVTVGNEPLRQELLRRWRKGQDVSLIGVLGDEQPGRLGEVRRMEIGKLTMTGGAIVFADAPVFAELNLDRRPAILLGMSSIEAFEGVDLDFVNQRVAFDLPPPKPFIRTNCTASLIANHC